MRVVASIEARMSSSRLPGKVLMDIAGKPAIERVTDRLRQAKRVDDIVLAIPEGAADDPLADWAARAGVAVHRGSEDDVLARVVGAQRSVGGELVVEVTGDCTLLDPEIIDWGVETWTANQCDVATNVRIPSFPQGADVQVFPLTLLEEVSDTIDDPAVREHVSLYFYENPQRYRIVHMLAPPRWRSPETRLQLDYAADRQFLQRVYQALIPRHGERFGVPEVLTLLAEQPDIAAINRHCEEKAVR